MHYVSIKWGRGLFANTFHHNNTDTIDTTSVIRHKTQNSLVEPPAAQIGLYSCDYASVTPRDFFYIYRHIDERSAGATDTYPRPGRDGATSSVLNLKVVQSDDFEIVALF